jgi:hypothetical protein
VGQTIVPAGGLSGRRRQTTHAIRAHKLASKQGDRLKASLQQTLAAHEQAKYEKESLKGLSDLSRRPHHSQNHVSAEVEAMIVAARLQWKWGPRKLGVKLCEQDSRRQWPAVSTIAAVLNAKGLVVNRRRRARTPVQRPPFVAAEEPNAVWCGNYKGWFRTGDATRIDPLTITDACSRYLLRCQKQTFLRRKQKTKNVQQIQTHGQNALLTFGGRLACAATAGIGVGAVARTRLQNHSWIAKSSPKTTIKPSR